MKKQFARAMLAAALLCSSAGAAIVVSTSPSYAEEHLSRDVGRALNDAIKAIQAQDYKTAADKLQAADAVSDKSDFDKLKIDQVKGFLALQQKDYAAAATAYEGVVSSPAFATLQPDEQKTTLHNGLVLSAQSKHWANVISDAKLLEKLEPLDAKTQTILAQAYYLTNDFTNAGAAAKKAVDMSNAAGQKPEQAALQILMSAQSKAGDQAAAEKTLEQLAVNYGEKSDWGQLLDVAMGTKGLGELDALYLYRLRFLIGAPAMADDYRVAAGIAVHQGYPTEAEAILKQGIAKGTLTDTGKTRTLMEQAREGARADERSLKHIAELAERSKKGEQDVKLAEDYWGYGRYQDAITAAQRGIAKGGLKDPSEGYYILGISQAAAGQYAEAEQTLQKVDGAAARANGAHLWALYAKSKAPAPAAAATPASAQPQ